MDKRTARKAVIEYLKKSDIIYTYLTNQDDSNTLDLYSGDQIYLSANIDAVIGGQIETTVRFEENGLTCKSYYCQPVLHNLDEIYLAARILAYMNHNLNWDCNGLYEHMYGMVEEDGDIYNYCRCRYELVEGHFKETMDHILNYSVQQLADVCVPLLGHVYGKIPFEQATECIWESCKR